MRYFTFAVLLLFLSTLLLGGCVNAPTPTPTASVDQVVYTVSNADGTATAVITWNGKEWTCSLQNCAQVLAISGNLMRFFDGMEQIAEESTLEEGELIMKNGWKIMEENK